MEGTINLIYIFSKEQHYLSETGLWDTSRDTDRLMPKIKTPVIFGKQYITGEY